MKNNKNIKLKYSNLKKSGRIENLYLTFRNKLQKIK